MWGHGGDFGFAHGSQGSATEPPQGSLLGSLLGLSWVSLGFLLPLGPSSGTPDGYLFEIILWPASYSVLLCLLGALRHQN